MSGDQPPDGDTPVASAAQMLDEMRETVPREFDFAREARLMKALGERLRAAGHAAVLVPEPLAALTSPRLLVMQRMQGDDPAHDPLPTVPDQPPSPLTLLHKPVTR